MKKLLSISDAENLTMEQVWSLYRKYISSSQVQLLGTFSPGRELVDYAEGCYIFLKSGKKILDLTGGIGVLNHGHNHKEIIKARIEFQNKKRMEVHKNFFSPYTAALSSNIAALLPGDLNISFFPNSGAEAVEGALKMAFKYHQGLRSTVLHSDISFHGKLLGAASVTGSPELNFKFPRIGGTDSFVYGDHKDFLRVVDIHRKESGESDIYAVIIEPLNASSMRSIDSGQLKLIREVCTREKIVLIFDEVYTGWGKTGKLFNFMRVEDLIPDIVTYAKSFGGGKASISGYTAREFIARKAYDSIRDATLHSTTYYGFGEETITAITSINEIINGGLLNQSELIGKMFQEFAKELKKNNSIVHEIRGSGALWGIVLEKKFLEIILTKLNKLKILGQYTDENLGKKLIVGSVINHLYNKHGVLTYFGSNRELPLIISFPLVAEHNEIRFAFDALQETLSSNIAELAVEFAYSVATRPK